MGKDAEKRKEGKAGGGHGNVVERPPVLKHPGSAMSPRASRVRNLHVNVSRLGQAGALDSSTENPLYSPLATPFTPDLSTHEVGYEGNYCRNCASC